MECTGRGIRYTETGQVVTRFSVAGRHRRPIMVDMCNLYNMTSNVEAIRRLFSVSRIHAGVGNLAPLAEIYPGYDAPVVQGYDSGERELKMMSWGFVLPQQGAAPKRITNARADKVTESRFWKESFENRRCLVPVTAFCEWTDSRPKVKHWFEVLDPAGDEPLFAFAGIWRPWKGRLKDDLVELETFSFLTTEANDIVRPVHAKAMPVLLVPDQFDLWMEGAPEDALELARPFPAAAMRDLNAV